jgi:hypothetical protein
LCPSGFARRAALGRHAQPHAGEFALAIEELALEGSGRRRLGLGDERPPAE